MTTKRILKVVALVLTVCIFIASAFLIGRKTANTTEPTTTTQPTYETTVQSTTGVITQPIPEITTQPAPEITTQPAQNNVFDEIKICLYYKVNDEFKVQDITKYLAESIDTAETASPTEVEKIMDGERQYIEPEVRLYGVPLGQTVSVTCESMITKAHFVTIGQNDGAYQYYYWQPRMYSVSEQGDYSFKITIQEGETEKVMYYKIAV